MSNINLIIGGRTYSVACADGEEAHITRLGGIIQEKLDVMGDNASQNESRGLLFAALLMADELHERRNTGAQIAATAPNTMPENMPDRLAMIAERLENLASTLEA